MNLNFNSVLIASNRLTTIVHVTFWSEHGVTGSTVEYRKLQLQIQFEPQHLRNRMIQFKEKKHFTWVQKEKSKMGKLPLIMQRWCSWVFAFVSPLGAALTSSDRPRSTQHTELWGVILSETIRLVKCTELGYCPAKMKGLGEKKFNSTLNPV